MKVVVVTNGDIKDLTFLKKILADASTIICADGAAKYLKEINIAPHLLLGDMDSIDEENLQWVESSGISLIRFPARKDATDTELAVDYAVDMKPHEIIIVGGVGSRWDHSLSNIFLLKKLLAHRIKARIVNELNDMTIINDSIELEGEIGETLSIVPISEEVKGVNLYGLEYPLVERDFSMGSSLGISNRFKEAKVKITLREGVLLVIRAKD